MVQAVLLLVTIALLAIRRNRLAGSAITPGATGVAVDAVAADMAVSPVDLDEAGIRPDRGEQDEAPR